MKPKTTISNQVHNLEIAMQLVELLDSDLGMSSLDELYLNSWARAVHLADELMTIVDRGDMETAKCVQMQKQNVFLA